MAISITGANSSVQAVPVAAIQPESARADSQAKVTAIRNPSAKVPALQSRPDQPAPPNTISQQNHQKADSVELSAQAKALMLRDQGRPLSEIAIIMNLDIKTVQTYLGGVSVTTRTAQTAFETSQQYAGQAEVSAENKRGQSSG